MRILAVNFFPAFHPPSSGGEQRYYYLYWHLSKTSDVTLLSPTYSNAAYEEVAFSPSFREVRIPKPAALDRIHWQLSAAGIGPECSAYVFSLGAAVDAGFSAKLAELASRADLIVHESPFTLPYDRTISYDGKPRAYNAYNVEHRLAAQILRGEVGRRAVDFIYFLERSLARQAAIVLATSEDERRQLAADFDVPIELIALAPNGFEPMAALDGSATPRSERSVLFMGSAHPPNIEAARFVVEQLAPRRPDVVFNLVGAVCKAIGKDSAGNVRLLGFVDEAEKNRLLRSCTLAINPLFSGAGTNLKMLDYLSAAAPVLTTPIGARGLELVDDVTAFVAEPARFADRLDQVLADRRLRERVAEAGHMDAHARFPWQKIAAQASDAFARAVEANLTRTQGSSRPLAVVLNDFAVANPTSGGQVRINALLREIGRTFDVVLICLTSQEVPFQHRIAPHVLEIGIPKTEDHRLAELEVARGEAVSVADILAARYCDRNTGFTEALRSYVDRCAVVVFEHPFLAPMLGLVPRHVPVVYSSLNVETDLKASLLQSRKDGAAWARQAAELERAMLARAKMVVCVSQEDRARFKRMRADGNYVVVENGVEIETGGNARTKKDGGSISDKPLAVFLGSSHMPNVDAARFIIDEVASAAPEIGFAIVGSVCDGVRFVSRPSNVGLFGALPAREKNALLGRAWFGVNPMFGGGGSSLKIADFLAAGLPVVSTSLGVRGYSLDAGLDFILAEPHEFAARLRQLRDDPELRRRLSRRALAIARNELDWRFLGDRYRRALHNLIGNGGTLRALVVTYRFADPPPGGAEAYLVNLLKEMRRRGRFEVDVVTCDVSQITNYWHFSARYEMPSESGPDPAYVNALYRFPVDEPIDDEFHRCERLFALWMRESRGQARALERVRPEPVLGGGWNFPETRAGTTVRWTSTASDVLVDEGAIGLTLKGHAPGRAKLRVLHGERQLCGMFVHGHFAIELELARSAEPVTFLIDTAFHAPGDPRELGVVVERIVARYTDGECQIDMADDYSTIMRRADSDKWVASLVGIVQRRSASEDADFLAVRGPHSAALNRWLERYVRDYDVVLAQGVPFAPLVAATDVATRHGVPIVLLPHFHLEDRYYHWKSYYDAFRKATAVLAAPAQFKSELLDVIGAHAVCVPGGGVDLAEFSEPFLTRAKAAFSALRNSDTPFVLVLGRKADGKNYAIAIDAIRRANGTRDIDLVMIGPDEDGIPITEPRVAYYGSQPRQIVLGALANATCVVNMSDSESFGIVLLEAWCGGTPVIAQRRCMAFNELVVDGTNGILAETAEEVAAAILAYAEDRDLAVRHAANGRLVAEAHSWSRLGETIEHTLIAVAATSQSATDKQPTAAHASGICQ